MEREIYIILTDSGTIPGRLVAKVTHFSYSHVMLSLHKDLSDMYSFGRRSVYNFLNGGFVVEHPRSAFFTRFSETRCRILALPIDEAQGLRLEAAIRPFLDAPECYHYDFLGCGLRYFGCKKTFAQHYTCSHFVAEMLEKAGIWEFPKGTMLARPADLLNIANARTIYEGKLKNWDWNQESI